MKTFRLFALVGIFLTISIVVPQPSAAFDKDQIDLDQHPNYVVIGAFSIQRNAVKFTGHANKLNMHAKFELNPNRNLYYVYVLSTDDREEAIHEAQKLRAESEFNDTWVYSGNMGKMDGESTTKRGIDINPVTQKKMETVPAEKNSASFSNPVIDKQATVISGEESAQNQITASTDDKSLLQSSTTNDVAKESTEISGKGFVFKIFRAIDNAPVEGDVDIIDNEKSKKLATYKGNAPVKVVSPTNKSGEVSLVCEVFGYRKVQRDVNYAAPTGDGISSDESNNVVVPFELVRLQKGDIAVMYNVYFFKDAGIMRPESRFEVNSLLEMLNENPKYKIKIHGHTNGGAAGKIISMAKDSKNFFALNDTKEGFGSAKKLSEERAAVIRDYLIANGVDPKRMQIKAWGGKRAIHDKHSARANENVRVEVEILEN